MNVAVIPARGGSKRIPRKNVREFAGKPMIAHSIDCVLRSGLFERVVVSTDDEETARIAGEFGAETPFRRPAELSDDHAGTIEVIAHAIRHLQGEGAALSAVCCVYATAPFIREQDLARGLGLLTDGGWRYVFSAAAYASPIARAFRAGGNGGLEMLFPDQFSTRSQDLPEVLHDAAQFYWGRPEAWLDGAKVFDRRSTVVVLPRSLVQDIDTPEDWERAESMWQVMHAAARS